MNELFVCCSAVGVSWPGGGSCADQLYGKSGRLDRVGLPEGNSLELYMLGSYQCHII